MNCGVEGGGGLGSIKFATCQLQHVLVLFCLLNRP